MSEYVTPGGLVVTDRRGHLRARERPQIDPALHTPNANPATGSVGPEFAPGDPNEVIFGWHAEAWDGWPPEWGTPPYGDAWSGVGYGRTPITARVSTAMTCVDLNSRQLASFPAYGLRGNERFDLPAWKANPEPELYASWSEFMHSVVNSLLIRGDAFQYCTGRYANGAIARFVNLNPDAVGVELIDGRLEYLIDGEPVMNRNDLCHIKYQSWPGRLRGISPLEWASRSLITAMALERYATNLATRGGIPWAVLKAQRNINKKQAQDAQAAWVAGAQSRMGAPAVIGNAFELEPLSFSPDQMALLGLREFDERRICAAFGVPGFLVNVQMADGLTYANAGQLFDHHWRATLRPLAQVIAEPWSGWLLPRGSIMEFDPDRYVQPPLPDRADAYNVLFNIFDPATGARALTIPEIRGFERWATQEPKDLVPAVSQAPATGSFPRPPLTGWEEG